MESLVLDSVRKHPGLQPEKLGIIAEREMIEQYVERVVVTTEALEIDVAAQL
jgi:hypothetical protein